MSVISSRPRSLELSGTKPLRQRRGFFFGTREAKRGMKIAGGREGPLSHSPGWPRPWVCGVKNPEFVSQSRYRLL